jgi:hypothetical protein
MADNTAPIKNVGARAKHGSFAYLPGTGPSLYRCIDCGHGETDRTKFFCGKYFMLVGRRGDPIPKHSKTCKYFEAAKGVGA